MEKKNSFPFKLFLEQWLPRLVALGILGYLAYSLFFRQDQFSWLHIITLAIAMGLILAPMARRLKVPNVIDFESKLDTLEREQRETKAQLNQLTNQISTVISMRFSPVQVMSFQGIRELLLADQQGENQSAGNKSTGKTAKYTKEDFLRRANTALVASFLLLRITRSFQVAINEHRLLTHDIYQTKTLNETIKHLVSSILESDLAPIFPFQITDNDNKVIGPIVTPQFIEGLRQISSFVDLYERVQTGEKERPSPADAATLFDEIATTLSTLEVALGMLGSHSILYKYRVKSFISSLSGQIDSPDTDQKSTPTSPPDSH